MILTSSAEPSVADGKLLAALTTSVWEKVPYWIPLDRGGGPQPGPGIGQAQ